MTLATDGADRRRASRGRSVHWRSTSPSATASPRARGCAPGEAWPELLAGGDAAGNPELELRNLAVEGATSAEVPSSSPEALELEPDLVTVVCGANDVLRTTRPDPERYANRLERDPRAARAGGAPACAS